MITRPVCGIFSVWRRGVTETVLPDPAAWMDHHAIADQRMHDGAPAPITQSRPISTPGPITRSRR